MSTLKVLVVGDEVNVGDQIALSIKASNHQYISIPQPSAFNQYLAENPDLILANAKHQNNVLEVTRINKVNIPILLFERHNSNIKLTQFIQPIEEGIEHFLTTYTTNSARRRNSQTLFHNSFYVKNKNKLERVEINDILWIQSDKKYCTIVTTKKKFVIRIALKQIEYKLNPAKFTRIHRSYIVQTAYIESINTTLGEAYINAQRIPIGKKYQDTLFQQLNLL